MKALKKLTVVLLAMLLAGTAIVGCGGDGGKNSESTSSDSQSSSEKKEEPCTDVKGHEYSEKTGYCIRCNQKAVIPDLPQNQSFPLVEPCTHGSRCRKCDYLGAGTEYDRIELFEDCYTIEIPNSGDIWLSFDVEEPGQYLLYSIGGDNGVTVNRHNANSHYVPTVGVPAVVEDGNFYSYVSCTVGYYNTEWRATYHLTGTQGSMVKVCFVRFSDPAWEPKNVQTKIYPTEINGKKAGEAPANMKLVDVPYETEYYFDESVGYYRMGSADAPGEIIYAAIDRVAPRLFNENKFTAILENAGTALHLSNGVLEDGNYSVLDYTPFIMNWKDENAVWNTSRPDPNNPDSTKPPEGDPDKNCYQNFCNSDGVYPVTQELHDFLQLYTTRNKPADIESDVWQEAPHWLWLSGCFYYKELIVGTEENPMPLQLGSNVFTDAFEKYCMITEPGTYVLKCADENLKLDVTGRPTSPFDITVEVTEGSPLVFRIYAADYTKVTATLTIEKVLTEGANEITVNENTLSAFRFYGDANASYTATVVIDAKSTVTNVTIGANGYAEIEISIPQNATADENGNFTGTITFTKN